MAKKLTPMFEQYLQIKEDHPDALLFYRMGDFYELFFEDAETAARELSITLTSRNPNDQTKIPMAGVPHHAARDYLNKLLEKGYKVAVCDQIEDPKQAKGLVKRAVTRVLTPATTLDEDTLRDKDRTHLAALYWSAAAGRGGLGWLEYSTGEWSGFESARENELWQWAQKINPRELLVDEAMEIPALTAQTFPGLTRMPGKTAFDHKTAARRIMEAQNVQDLKVLDLDKKRELTQALGALLLYVQQTQMHKLTHLAPFKPLNLSKHLLLDEVTERNLELFRRLDGKPGKGALIATLDFTQTPMGGRLLRDRLGRPWREPAPILETQAAVAFFVERDETRRRVREALDAVYDLERCITRIFLGRATPKDFVALRVSLTQLPSLRELLETALAADVTTFPPEGAEASPPQAAMAASSGGEPVADEAAASSAQPKALGALLAHWDDLTDFRDLLTAAIVDNPPPVITEGGLFHPGYRPELTELAELADHGEAALEKLLQEEREACNLPRLKLGMNRVFGYYFELPAGHAKNAPERFVRRQTLANAERFTTEELKTLEERIMRAAEERKRLEYTLFQELRQLVADARQRFLFMADMVANVDVWQGLAEAARRNNWVRPAIEQSRRLIIEAGRHPVVEAVQGAANFIPNDLHMDEDRRLLLITGPNMAGKSTVLRQSALIVILAQLGGYVPANRAVIGLADRVFSRVGASDNLAQGQSTFMVEMTETARILRQAGRRSLVILDEIGRGTSTFDGLALAWAVVEELATRGGKGPRKADEGAGVRTLFATHYHELTALEGQIPGLRNLNIAVKEWAGDIVFLRRLVPGPSDRSYGVEVAKLAGTPQRVVTRAKEILAELEARAGKGESHRAVFKGPSAEPQQLLPGVTPPAREGMPEEPPSLDPTPDELATELAEELTTLDLDAITPLEALSLLQEWRARLVRDVSG